MDQPESANETTAIINAMVYSTNSQFGAYAFTIFEPAVG